MLASARYWRLIVQISAALLALGVGYISARGEIFGAILQSLPPDLISRFTIVVLYLSWVFGVSMDINLHEMTLVTQRKVSANAQIIAIIAGLMVLFIMMSFAETVFQRIAFMFLFMAFDILGYAYYRRYVLPDLLAVTVRIYEEAGDHIMLEKAEVLKTYQCAPWRTLRYAASTLFLVVFGAAFFTDLGLYAEARLPDHSMDFVFAALFFLFIAAHEGSMWVKRLGTSFSLQMIDRFDQRYTIQRRGVYPRRTMERD